MTLRTPLLQMLANVYGHIGYQLNPIELSHLTSILRFALNLSIDAYIIYVIIKQDSFVFELFISLVPTSKPLFTLVLNIFIQYGNIILNVLNIIYFGFFGKRIFLLLDSSCFYKIFYSAKESKCIFYQGVVYHSLLFVFLNASSILELLRKQFKVKIVVIMICLYILSALSSLVIYLLLYQQFATKRVLAKLKIDIDLRNSGN